MRRHWKRHGRFPNIILPKTFNEKVLYRVLFDRRSLLTRIQDKLAVRSYVDERLGPSILPELYHVTIDPDTIPFDKLPQKFVIKPTHGSGWIQIVTDRARLDLAALAKTCRDWLSWNYYEASGEWCYKNIPPCVILEQFIDDGTGNVPDDYKVFVFDGVVEMVQVDTGRFTEHRRGLYSPNWERLPVLLEYGDLTRDVPRPAHLAEMIAAAEKLGKGLDFIRADFYDTPDRLYFGELTTYPGGGLDRFHPAQFDSYLGSRWKLSAVRRG